MTRAFEPIPHVAPPLWPEPGPKPGRMAHAILRNDPEMVEDRALQGEVAKCRVALIGLADDLGVELNGGRVGAAGGPNAFRAALATYGVAEPEGWEWPRVFDVGNILPAPGDDARALEETHRRVTQAVRSVLEMSEGRLFPIAIGGGHDLTFPFVRAVIEFWRTRGIDIGSGVYFDAHLDVRDTPGSGMPFRRLIEDCGVNALVNFGLNPMVNTRDHRQYFEGKGGVVGDQLQITRPSFVSFDMDVLDASHAPGVSAINPCGWTAWEAEMFVQICALSPHVMCFDIMEFNPEHDVGGRTARLAAHLFLTFLKNLAMRGERP